MGDEHIKPSTIERLGLSPEAVLDFFDTLPARGLIFHGVRNADHSINGIKQYGLDDAYVRVLNPKLDQNPQLQQLLQQRDAEGLINTLIQRIASGEYVGDPHPTQNVALVIAHFFRGQEIEGLYHERPSMLPQPRKRGGGNISTSPRDIKGIFVRPVTEPAEVFTERIVKDLVANRQYYNTERTD